MSSISIIASRMSRSRSSTVGGIQNTSIKSSAIRSAMRGFSRSRIDICPETRGGLNQMQDREQIERWGFAASGRVDKYIKIAVRACIAGRPRSEKGKLGHALGLNCGRDLAQFGEGLFKCDVCDVAHG